MALNPQDLPGSTRASDTEVTLKEFRKNLTQITGQTFYNKKRVRVTSYGRVMGYFVPASEVETVETADTTPDPFPEYEEEDEELDPEEIEDIERHIAAGPNQRGIPIEEVMRRLGL